MTDTNSFPQLKNLSLDKSDRDSGLPSRTSSISSTGIEDTRSQNLQRHSESSGTPRRPSWNESQLSTYSSGEIADVFDPGLRRVHSVTGPRRSSGSGRVRRSESAREGGDGSAKKHSKVRRSISERDCEDPPGRRHKHRHHHRSKNSRSQTSIGPLSERSSQGGSSRGLQRKRSLNDSVVVELGSSGTRDMSNKESQRKRIVFAVVVISLALLTASVFLVAITLLLSPAVDAAMRKENEEMLRVIEPQATPQPMEGTNQTLLTTGHPG